MARVTYSTLARVRGNGKNVEASQQKRDAGRIDGKEDA